MEVIKLTEEQFKILRTAKRQLEAIDDATEVALTRLVEMKAEQSQAMWENIEQIAGVKCNDGKNLRINWASATVSYDDFDETKYTEVGD